MKKNSLKTIICSLLVSIGMNSALADDDIVCPASVKTGKALIVNATITNKNWALCEIQWVTKLQLSA
jgi:hypothetical protein